MSTKEESMSPDEIEDEVLNTVPTLNAAELEEVYTLIDLDCKEELKGKKNNLLKCLLKHLCDPDGKDDGGLSTMLVIQKHLNKEVDKKDTPKQEIIDKNILPSKPLSETKIDVMKLKDFKISGTIGSMGEKDKLSFTSLVYQIENAKKMNYHEQMICAAVIKAISPSNHLRTYLESTPDLTLKNILEILRSHFKEKDSASVFTEFQNAAQSVNETSLEFILRLMCMRQKVLTLSNEEGCPYDKILLNKRFFHTMFTGLRNINIRAELRENCKNDFTLSDEKLLKFASEVIANETERNEKLNSKKSITVVNVVESEKKDTNSEIKKKKENSFMKIQELKLSHEKEMTALRAELAEIKSAILAKPSQNGMNSEDGKGTRNVPPYIPPHQRINRDNFSRRKRCRKCERENVYRCFHCFLCESSEHRMFECPSKKKN